jgi:hypothetical protein
MAKPVGFDQANTVLGPPPGRADEIDPLFIYRYNGQCVSCWRLSPEELEEVKRTGCIFVNVLSGETQPPILIWAGPLAAGLF